MEMGWLANFPIYNYGIGDPMTAADIGLECWAFFFYAREPAFFLRPETKRASLIGFPDKGLYKTFKF